MDSCDIAIVGGGPCGSFAAISALSHNKNNNVTIFEKRKTSGYPPHCSGLIGIDGLKSLRVYNTAAKKVAYNKIRRAKFISPAGKSIIIERKRNELLVLDRPLLDLYLAEQAQKLGALFKYECSVSKIRRLNDKQWQLYTIQQKKKPQKLCSSLIISAEGHHPTISSQAGLPFPSKKWFFPALQYEFANATDIDRETVELYFGGNIAPGFFAWFIPLSEHKVRVGLATHPSRLYGARKYLDNLIKKHPILSPRLKHSSKLNSWGGFVPANGPIAKTFTDGLLVVGDAAGQTKATTGGGFNIGGYCGLLAGKVASQSIENNNYSAGFLKRYQQLWHSKFEPELTIMKFFRRILTFLPDKTLDGLFDIALQTNLTLHMQNIENIDLHGIVLFKYSLSPNVMIRGLKYIPHVVISMFNGLLY